MFRNDDQIKARFCNKFVLLSIFTDKAEWGILVINITLSWRSLYIADPMSWGNLNQSQLAECRMPQVKENSGWQGMETIG